MGQPLQGYGDDEVAEAVKVAAGAQNVRPAKYIGQAVEMRLRAEGYLPESEPEAHALALVREARAAGVDVDALLSAALATAATEGSAA